MREHISLVAFRAGAGVVNVVFAFETIDDMIRQGMPTGTTRDAAVANTSSRSTRASSA